jgi:hypothetical protein
MRVAALVVSILCACSDPARVLYQQPRLASVGPYHTTFDANGFPTQMDAFQTTYTFTWSSEQLSRVIAVFDQLGPPPVMYTVTMTPTYTDGRVTRLDSAWSGTTQVHTDLLQYNANGSLKQWQAIGGLATGHIYTYDAGLLTSIDDDPGASSTIEYNTESCPIAFTTFQRTDVQYEDGRLAEATYNDDGFIAQLSGAPDMALVYEDGNSTGLNLWPALVQMIPGGPPHGELFRLDGRCDATMTSQDTILSLVIRSALHAFDPAGP